VKFNSVVLDVDSTLCGVEGIDWLAQRRGGDVAARVRALTDRAMNGEIALDAVYAERLAIIKPAREDIDALTQVYRQTIAEGAARTIAKLRGAGIAVVLVSGGIRQAIAPLARELGVSVEAVELRFRPDGGYSDFDRMSPLATQQGKHDVIRRLALARPIVAVGDGSTDLAMKPAVDRFVAYTGFARRPPVVGEADAEVASYAELEQLVLGRKGR
jgi:phosphoserine phosphatase